MDEGGTQRPVHMQTCNRRRKGAYSKVRQRYSVQIKGILLHYFDALHILKRNPLSLYQTTDIRLMFVGGTHETVLQNEHNSTREAHGDSQRRATCQVSKKQDCQRTGKFQQPQIPKPFPNQTVTVSRTHPGEEKVSAYY